MLPTPAVPEHNICERPGNLLNRFRLTAFGGRGEENNLSSFNTQGTFLHLLHFPEPRKPTEKMYKVSGTEGEILVSNHSIQQLFHEDPQHPMAAPEGIRVSHMSHVTSGGECLAGEKYAVILRPMPCCSLGNLHLLFTNRKFGHALGSLLRVTASPLVNASFSNEKD